MVILVEVVRLRRLCQGVADDGVGGEGWPMRCWLCVSGREVEI